MIKFFICFLFITSSVQAAIKSNYTAKKLTDYEKILEAEKMRKAGEGDEAVDLLSKIDSENDDIKLKKEFELAINYYNLGKYQKSISSINSFLDQNQKVINSRKQPSGEAILTRLKREILKQNPNIKERNKKIFNASLGAAYMHDSNPMFINSSTDSSYYGQLNLGSYTESDYGQNYQGSLGYKYEFENSMFLFGSLSGYITNYNKYHDKNSLRYSVLQGVGYQYGDNVTLSLPFQYTNISLNRSSYNSSSSTTNQDNSIKIYAINPSVRYDATRWLSFTTMGQFMHKNISFSDQYNNNNIGINEQISVKLVDRVFLILFGGVAKENSSISQYSYRSSSLGASVRLFLTQNFYIDPNISVQKLDYTNVYSSIGTERHDRYNNYGIGAHYIVASFMDFYINYTKMKSSSNVSLYNYDKNILTGGITLFY